MKQQMLDSVSHNSRSSKGSPAASRVSGTSTSSKMSSVIAMKRAKAEAARARLEFAELEAGIRKQQAQLVEQEKLSKANVVRKKAELDADLDFLAQKREAAAAEAEVQALESIDDGKPGIKTILLDRADSLGSIDPAERTRLYVSQQAELNRLNAGIDYDHHSGPLNETEGIVHLNPVPNTYPESPPVKHSVPFNANATTFQPYTGCMANIPEAVQQEVNSSQVVTNELTRFLLKKDLLFTRLSSFNDRPESYAVWKASFQSIMSELNVTAFEELDLLVKWLGPESMKHALSIRASNANNPSRGLQRIWERLDERYGCPEMVEAALKNKLANFPKLSIKDTKKLYDLSDILAEIESAKETKAYQGLLGYYDTSSGIIPIVSKLPYQLQEKWTTRAVNYKRNHGVSFPPFTIFADFIREMSRVKNDPGFNYDIPCGSQEKKDRISKPPLSRPFVTARKTEVGQSSEFVEIGPDKFCPLHKSTKHSLNRCRGFRAKSIEERRKILKENNICFNCCESSQHIKRTCRERVKCSDCGSNRHPTALHFGNYDPVKVGSSNLVPAHGGERAKTEVVESPPLAVTSNCTQICGEGFGGKSCAKTILVRVYPKEYPEKVKNMYAIIDDQSNRSLATSEFFTLFDIKGDEIEYALSSCNGCVTVSGRRASGYLVESLNRDTQLNLPTLIECNQIPNVRDEIPTPQVAAYHPHLLDIARYIPPLDEQSDILLLIGRDLLESHHVLDQRIGPKNSPYAQQLPLGWVIIGESCLGKVHKPDFVNVNKTHLLTNRRTSIFKPCENDFTVKECLSLKDSGPGSTVFDRTRNNDKLGLSFEDREFLKIMDNDFQRSPEGNWIAPLPFRAVRPRLPNNRPQAVKRAKTLDYSLQRNPVKRQHFVTFMKKVFDHGHAEIAPPLMDGDECWYLPIFGVYHPRKPDQIRGVFDSSAKYSDVSLNSVLLSGPDMTNSLLGILLRFRKDSVAVTADIEQMFHCFKVTEPHRNFLRFLWYRDNDPAKEIIEYRMCVHVFGNSPSPAVATYGLRKTAANNATRFEPDVNEFVERNFYVDDGLASFPTGKEAIDLMKRTQEALRVEGNLCLHKIASNSDEVMKAFPSEDLAKGLKDLDFSDDSLPLQRSLGLSWDLKSDTFTFQVSSEEKPYTRRGVLSVVNSIFDPIGFVAPVTIQGKLFLRSLMSSTINWDEPLPDEHQAEWKSWKDSLQHLEQLQISRTCTSMSR